MSNDHGREEQQIKDAIADWKRSGGRVLVTTSEEPDDDLLMLPRMRPHKKKPRKLQE